MFQTVSQAIVFYIRHNPARQKFFNPFEPEKCGKTAQNEDFSGISSKDLWAKVLHAIIHTLKFHGANSRAVFSRFYRDIDADDFESMDSICKDIGISSSTGYKYLNEIHEDLERELIRRGLMPAPMLPGEEEGM